MMPKMIVEHQLKRLINLLNNRKYNNEKYIKNI